MARLGEVPFAPLLRQRRCDAALRHAGRRLLRAHRRSRRRSAASGRTSSARLQWIDTYGDPRSATASSNTTGKAPPASRNQGWKDSGDAIFHADGELAEGPIALCEVQGYVYAAKRHAARAGARARRRARCAARLDAGRRDVARSNFEEAFWCEELSTYAMALDGEKRPCRVITSNAGHALLTGIAAPDRAARVAETLLRVGSFSGWGIRTVAMSAARYNPISYHNGSVWPHDNAMIALGLARYGFKEPVLRILTGLFDAALVLGAAASARAVLRLCAPPHRRRRCIRSPARRRPGRAPPSSRWCRRASGCNSIPLRARSASSIRCSEVSRSPACARAARRRCRGRCPAASFRRRGRRDGHPAARRRAHRHRALNSSGHRQVAHPLAVKVLRLRWQDAHRRFALPHTCERTCRTRRAIAGLAARRRAGIRRTPYRCGRPGSQRRGGRPGLRSG